MPQTATFMRKLRKRYKLGEFGKKRKKKKKRSRKPVARSGRRNRTLTFTRRRGSSQRLYVIGAQGTKSYPQSPRP